jgi:C4-type Zn-finger protein
LLAALDREAELADCHCPSCDKCLMAEPRRRERILTITLTEETTLRCPRCGFTADVTYRELTAYHRDCAVVIDGRMVREEHHARPSHEVSGLDEAGDIVW